MVPILKQGGYLIASIQSSLNDRELAKLQENLVKEVTKERARGVIIDVTVLDAMDSYATRVLRDTANMIKLRGAPTVIVGIQPEIAFSLVQLGLTLGSLRSALDLEEGLALLEQMSKDRN